MTIQAYSYRFYLFGIDKLILFHLFLALLMVYISVDKHSLCLQAHQCTQSRPLKTVQVSPGVSYLPQGL